MLDAITFMLVLIIMWDIILKTASNYLDRQVKDNYALLLIVMYWTALYYVLYTYGFHWLSVFCTGIGVKLLIHIIAGLIVAFLRSKA